MENFHYNGKFSNTFDTVSGEWQIYWKVGLVLKNDEDRVASEVTLLLFLSHFNYKNTFYVTFPKNL